MNLLYYLIAQKCFLEMNFHDYDFLNKSKLELYILQSKEKAGNIQLENK